MNIIARCNARFAAFWTRRRKIFFLLPVIFITFSYYYLSLGGPTVEFAARNNTPFSLYYLLTDIYGMWGTHIFQEYFLFMSPFLLLYLFWWRKPNIWRFILPCCFLYLIATKAIYFTSAMSVPWSYAVNGYPDYISQIPAWLRFLFLR